MKKIGIIVLLGVTGVIGCAYFLNRLNVRTQWEGFYKKDVQAVYDLLQENHPGYYDDQNPAFKKWLMQGYDLALNKAGHVHSYEEYILGLDAFVKGFKDNHLSFTFNHHAVVPQDCEKTVPVVSSIKELSNKQVWIKLPSFYPQTDEAKEALNNVIAQMPAYKDYELIIFDVRGNTGGNSHYPTLILNNLYGEKYCNAVFKKMRAKQYVEWRASSANIQFLKSGIPQLEKQFGKGDLVEYLRATIDGMEKSKEVGNPLYAAADYEAKDCSKHLLSMKCPLHACVIVITDSRCVSACLDFLDELFAVGPAVQIGLTTNVDTEYLECRDVKLPDGRATLFFPMKVFRNRPRKANQAYVPQYEVADVWNDQALQQVIKNIMASRKTKNERP